MCTCTTSLREPPTLPGHSGVEPCTRMRSHLYSASLSTDQRVMTSLKWDSQRKWWHIGLILLRQGETGEPDDGIFVLQHLFYFRNPSFTAANTWTETYWPLHTPHRREVLHLNARNTSVMEGLRVKQCAFWRKFLPQLGKMMIMMIMMIMIIMIMMMMMMFWWLLWWWCSFTILMMVLINYSLQLYPLLNHNRRVLQETVVHTAAPHLQCLQSPVSSFSWCFSSPPPATLSSPNTSQHLLIHCVW